MLTTVVSRVLRRSLASTTQLVCRSSSSSTQSPPNDLDNVVHLPTYTEDQRHRILQIINERSLDDLLSFDITKTRAKKLDNWKLKNGPLKELNDILYVEGFGLKVVQKFYKSLLDTDVNTNKPHLKLTRARSVPFCTPVMDEDQRKRIKSSVAVRIGVTTVSWSRMELDAKYPGPQITHWQHHELNDKKLHLAELSRRCLYVIHQIPEADCYILENPQMAQINSNPGSIDQQNVNIQKAQITSIISYALIARADPSSSNKSKHNVYFLRRFLASRLFHHLVGTERVSTEDTMLAMMDHRQRPDEDYVHFPSELCSMYHQMERYQRELLGQSFLLNLAFVRLVLLQDPTSLATVSRSKKNPTNVEEFQDSQNV
ncbi:uncharacterized protein [Drosophila tropicalis]|uniref:uncharacterized protein n=1 Tax=Drosophila tropicalis TaxID=46794 RepID=UPI0035ABF21D